MDLVKFTLTEIGAEKEGGLWYILHPRKSKLPWLLTALNVVIMLLVLTIP